MSQLGRIGGQALTDNLLRAGVDLAFETDLLYLDVINQKIGINTSPPVYDLDVNSEIKSLDQDVDNVFSAGNLRISANTISTSVGGIDVYVSGNEIFHDILTTEFLNLNGNKISSISNSNIVLDPNGSGTVELLANTNITGNLTVSGNITMAGNLTGLGTLTLGDQTIDTVTVNTDFTQDLLPGIDLTYALGADAGDSSPRRWAQLHSPEWRNINNGPWEGSGLRPLSVTISSQMTLDGVNNKISAIQSNEDILLNPDTGIVYIETGPPATPTTGLKFQNVPPTPETLDNPNAYSTSVDDRFGYSVSISGNYAIVGAYGEDDASGTGSGKAYIFNVTTGALVHTLDNPNAYSTSVGDVFGYSVAIDGNYAIIGARFEDNPGSGANSGKAYIFNVTSGTLVHTLNNPNAYSTSANDNFGESVSISGNYCIVGAWREDDAGGTDSGKAYIFDVTTGALVYTLNNPNAYSTSAGDIFGHSVAISGNYAIVGAHAEADAGGTYSGKAYIFNVTTGTLVHTLDNPNAYSTSYADQFGESVSISGNYCIVGAWQEDDAGGNSSGKAYIFDVTTGALVHTLNNPNAYTSAGDVFGYSVAISGNYAIVGAYQEDDAGGNSSGKTYIFNVTSGTLVYTFDNPNAYGTSVSDNFGYSVAISGNSAIVGAYNEDDAGGFSSGKAYFYNFLDGTPTITNLHSTHPLTFASTGTGYYNFNGNNAMVVPSGTTAEQRPTPDLGETRWNTEVGYLECFDGTVWVVSTGGGEEVTGGIMSDLGNAWTLILG